MWIREYRPADCEQMAELFYNTVHNVNTKDYTEEQVNAWATGRVDLQEWNCSFLKHKTIVAIENDEIVGFGDIADSGYLDRLFVHKDYQGIGVASAICNELEGSVKRLYYGKAIFSTAGISSCERAGSYSTGNCIDELCNGEVDSFQFEGGK